MKKVEVCPVCRYPIIGAPEPGAYSAHNRYCRQRLAQATADALPASRRPVADLCNGIGRGCSPYSRSECGPKGHDVPETATNGLISNVCCANQLDEQAHEIMAGLTGTEYPEEEDVSDSGSERSDHQEEPKPDDGTESGGQPESEDQHTFIEQELKYDDIVAWLLLDFSNEQKKKIFLAMRILATILGEGPEHDPFSHSVIKTVAAFDRYMNEHVDSFFCKMHASEVPVESNLPALKDMPAITLFKRALSEAISCSLASPKIEDDMLILDPIPAPMTQPAEDAPPWRANTYMHGSNILCAKQARVEHRLMKEGMAARSRPIIGLCIFFDKTIISPMAKRELYPVFIAPMNVDSSIRHEAIQLLCLVPNVKEWIHTHCPKGTGHILTSDLDAAIQATTTAVWKAMLSEVSQATDPDVGIWIKFDVDRAAILHHPDQQPVYEGQCRYIEVLCDLMVAALILDTPEAAATLGMVSRFACKADSDNAACLLCHTPACKYDRSPGELSAQEKQVRDSDQTETLRQENCTGTLFREGLFWDARFPWGQLHRLWGYDHLHHWQLGSMKRLGVAQLKAIVSTLGEKPGHTIKAMTNRVNRWYDEMAVFTISPFPRLPYGCMGGIIGKGDGVGQGKLQAAEFKRVQGVLTYIVDELPGACLYTATLALARMTVLGLLLSRDNLPHAGWTQKEADQLQHHISFVWLPAIQNFLAEIYSPTEADHQARVIKLHLLLCHATERLLTMGPLREYTTAPYETAHKGQKKAARMTTCTKANFTQQHALRASRHQSMQLAGYIQPALGAVMRGEVTMSSFVTFPTGAGSGERHRIQLPSKETDAYPMQQEVYPIMLDPVSAANRSTRGSAYGTRLFYVVLRVLSDTQAAERPHEASRGHPCATLRAAAGLLGQGPQHDRCNNIRQAALSLVGAGHVAQHIQDELALGITPSVVQATAEHVLRVPELLTIPGCIAQYLEGASPRQLQSTGGLAQTLLRLCFVCSNKLKFTYYNQADVERVFRRQVTCLNRDTHLNFFLTEREDAAQPMTYEDKLASMLAGSSSLQPRYWVFLLCTGLTMMVSMGREAAHPYMPLQVCDADEDPISATAQVCLIRWLHRVHKPGCRTGTTVGPVMQAGDPNAEHFGCERLVWARQDEPNGPKAQDRTALDRRLTTAAAPMRKQRLAQGQKVKRDEVEQSVLEQCIIKARDAVHNFGRDRYRADDVFRGVAYCSIASPKVVATPVRVLPVLGTERSDQWSPTPASSGAARRFNQFKASQGYKLSSYYQMRLDLHAVPRGYDDE